MGKPWTITSDEINASPERVFEVMSDFEHAADHVSGITRVEMLTDGPVGVGTKFKETRVMFGKEATETMEVTAFDPGKGYTLEAESCGCRYVSHLRCVPKGSGTQVELEMHCTPLKFSAKVMSKLMAPMMKGAMCKAMRQDFDDLQAVAEGGAATSAPTV